MDLVNLRNLAAVSLLVMSAGAIAQGVNERTAENLGVNSAVSREPSGAAELRAAIRRISFNPSDADALADAGTASLMLGDANAALNFFTRANGIRPNNGRIVAGLATATVRTENPFEALRLFDDAVRLGISERTIAADRALAFDLLGNFGRAQQDYALARTAASSDDLIIRQAISLSLAGQKSAADAMLVPLLEKNSAAAWRARAFMLAARGELRESAKVTQGFMDAGSAQRMERFLRVMPDLTGAQQAAAIHLGHFPASQYVGRDSEQLRRVAAAIPAVTTSSDESRLIPSGTPLGTKSGKAAPLKSDQKRESRRDRKAREREEVKVAAASIPEANRLPRTDSSRVSTPTAQAKIDEALAGRVSVLKADALPPPESARPLVSVPALSRPPAASERQASAAAVPQTGSQRIAALPAANLSSEVGQTPQVATPPVSQNFQNTASTMSPQRSTGSALAFQAPVTTNPSPGSPVAAQAVSNISPIVQPAAKPSATPAFDLASIVSAIEIPESEQKPSAVPVDLTKIKQLAPKVAATETVSKTPKIDPKLAAKAKLDAANPSRYWVQIATGEASALGFDYRKFSSKNANLFKGQNGWTSAWGKTSRLLVGPFADLKAAKKWEADYKKTGGDGFMWKSESGLVVTALKTK